MNVTQLKKGDRAAVLKTNLPLLLKERLRSLGVYTGAKITVLKISARKKTYLLQAGSSKVAVGAETAAGIQVWKI